MQFLYNNLLDDAKNISASSTRVGWDPTQLTNYHLAKAFSFNGNEGTIGIEFDHAVSVQDIILCGTNLTSSAIVKLEGNSTNSFSSPPYTKGLTLYSNGYAGEQGINRSYKYWQISISDPGVTYVEIGYLFIGDHLQLPGVDPGVDLTYNTETIVTLSKTRQSYADRGVNYFSSSFEFPYITDYSYDIDGKTISTREDILEFWLENQGAVPFIMIIFEKSKDRIPPMMGLINQDSLSFKFDDTLGFYSMKFNFAETK